MPKKSLLQSLLYLSPFFFPLYLIRFQLSGIPFTLLEAYIYLLFALWVIQLLRGERIYWNKEMKPYLLAAGVLFLGTTLSCIFAPELIHMVNGEDLNAQRVVWGLWKGFLVAPLMYFWVLLQQFRAADSVGRLLRYFSYSAALLVLVSYGFVLWGQGFTYDSRLAGPFETANYLALYVVPAFLILTYFLFQTQNKTQFYLNLMSWIILSSGLFLTKSYGAFLSIFGALGLWVLILFFQRPQWRKKLWIGLAGVCVLFVGLVASQWNTPKFKQALDLSGRSSSSVRIELYQTSLAMISEHPFLGLGPGLFEANYQINAPKVLERHPLEWKMSQPHNMFLAFWLNAGLLGLLAWLIFMVLAHRSFTYPLIALWGVWIHGMVDTPFWKNDLAVIFWLLVVAVMVMQKTKNPIEKRAN